MPAHRPQVNISFAADASVEYPEPAIVSRGRWAAGAVLLVVAVVAVYGLALRGKFIYFDDRTITDNLPLRSWLGGLTAIWIHPTIVPHFQPLAYTAFLLEHKLFSSTAPAGYLLANLLLHVANVLLLWTLLRKLEIPGALAAAALVAVHPVNVEAVAWISQQPLLLCGAFYLSALLVYLRYAGVNPPPSEPIGLRLPEARWMLYAMAVVLFGAALTSHAAAVSLPVAALVIIWWERGRLGKTDLGRLVPMLVMSLVWTAIVVRADVRRAAAMSGGQDTSVVAQMLVAGRAAWIYVAHILWPVHLSFAYPKWPGGTGAWRQGAFLLVAAAALGAAWRVRARAGRGPLATIALYFVVLVPMLGLFRTDLDALSPVADHLIYLPAMVVIVSLTALVAEQIPRHIQMRRWVMPAAASVTVAATGVLAILRVPDYRDTTSLWQASLRYDPGSPLAHNNLGLIELKNRNTSAAMGHFLAALRSDPDNFRTHLNIAAAYDSSGEIDKAIMQYYQARKLAPDDPDVHFGLATAFARQGGSMEAIREYQEVLRRRPDDVLTHNNLGLLHADRGEGDEALKCYDRAIKINPGFIPPYINKANLLFQQGQIQQAADLLARVVEIDPTSYEAFMNAGAMVGQMAQRFPNDAEERETLLRQSELFFRRAATLRPDSSDAYNNLGTTLMLQNKVGEAIFCFGRALELNPANSDARQKLENARAAQSSAGAP